jgi:dynein heavy chain
MRTIKESIGSLNKALDGTLLMSNELEDLLKSLLLGKVPELWKSKSYASIKPLGSFINDLSARIFFFQVCQILSLTNHLMHLC